MNILAQSATTIKFPKAIEETKFNSLNGVFSEIISILLIVAGGLAVIAILYSGIMYITAGADQAKAETAKKNLVWAIVGLLIISLAYVIIELVKGFLK